MVTFILIYSPDILEPCLEPVFTKTNNLTPLQGQLWPRFSPVPNQTILHLGQINKHPHVQCSRFNRIPSMGDTSETPRQETQKTCTRNSSCHLQGCLICCTPNNHVRNLDKALSSSNATPTSPTNVDLPQPLPDHIIMRLTYAFKQATSKLQDMESLAAINTRYIKHLETNGELFY